MDELFDDLRKELAEKVPELKVEFVRLVQDQIDDLVGGIKPVEVKVFGPDPVKLRELAAEVGKVVEASGAKDVDPHVHLGNPDILVRRSTAAAARAGLSELDLENQLDAALYGQVASVCRSKTG